MAARYVRHGLNRLRLLTVLIAMAHAADSPGQPIRDKVRIGGQHYLLAQQIPHQFSGLYFPGDISISAQGGRCAYAGSFPGFSQPSYLFLREFDVWARPCYDMAPVDNERAVATNGAICARFGERTWMFWPSQSQLLNAIRIFDPLGQPVTSTYAALNTYTRAGGLALALRNDMAAVVVGGQLTQQTPPRVHCRFFSTGGVPNSLVLSNTRSGEFPFAAFEAYGTLWTCYRDYADQRLYLQRVRLDGGTVEPEISASLEPVGHRFFYMRILPGGTILVAYRSVDATAAYVRMFDLNGLPIGAPRPIDPGEGTYWYVAADRVGRLVIASDAVGNGPDEYPWLRLYDADTHPCGDRVYFTRDPATLTRDFYNVNVGAAYDESGTIWIAWAGESGPSEAYLTSLKPYSPADMNLDNRVDNFDIDAFVLALSDPAAYAAQWDVPPDVIRFYGDCNGDGAFDNFDIDAFIECLNNGGCP